MRWRRRSYAFVIGTIVLLLVGCQPAAPAAAPAKPAEAPAAAKPAAPAAPQQAAKPAAQAPKETAKPAAPDRSKWPEKIRLASGPQGGSFFVFSSAWGNLLRDKAQLNVAVEVTQGSRPNLLLLEDKKAEISMSDAVTGFEGWTGTGWAKGKKYQDAWRAMIVSEPTSMQFWTLADRGIKTITDLNGKRVNLSQAGSGADTVGRRLFEVLSIKPSRIINVSHTAANQQLVDGLLDASFTVGGTPQPAVAELAATKDVVIAEIPKEVLDRVRDAFPTYVPGEIPAGTYRGQSKPIATANDWFYLTVRADLPNDFVYEVTRTTLEGKAQLMAAYKPAQQMAAENVQFLKVPLHCGAFKYYQEKGIAVPKDAQPVDKC